jgi:hypothetical protein
LLVARLLTQKADVLVGLLGAIAADPAALVSVATEAGVDARMFFACPDLMLLWCGLACAADYGLAHDPADRGLAFRFCQFLLKKYGLWEPVSCPGSNLMRWSDARLAELFESAPRSAAFVRKLAKDAVALHRRLCSASEHLRAAMAALEVA